MVQAPSNEPLTLKKVLDGLREHEVVIFSAEKYKGVVGVWKDKEAVKGGLLGMHHCLLSANLEKISEQELATQVQKMLDRLRDLYG